MVFVEKLVNPTLQMLWRRTELVKSALERGQALPRDSSSAIVYRCGLEMTSRMILGRMLAE